MKEVQTDISDLKSGQKNSQYSLNGIAKKFDIFEQEIIVTRHRLDKLENWAKMVSEKVEIPLPY